ncbi:MAG: hypothetical protein P8Y25_09830 [Chromatiaceae bacterium]
MNGPVALTARQAVKNWTGKPIPAGAVIENSVQYLIHCPTLSAEDIERLTGFEQRFEALKETCYGCHEQYDPTGRQWDQVAGRATPGRWDEQRWEVQAGPPPLGVTGDNRIAPAVPGMILTLEHPNWDKPLFRRLFSIFDPHTTGRSRACGDCHRSSRTLGLGEGRLVRDGEAWTFQACRPRLADGLPADAWTSLDGSRTGGATRVGNRPLRSAEMRRILDALPAPSVGVGGGPLTSVKADCRASP